MMRFAKNIDIVYLFDYHKVAGSIARMGIFYVEINLKNTGKHLSPAARQARILELVAQRGQARVPALARRFQTSDETIRRDLTILAEAGQLRKVHGGARALAAQHEGVFAARLRRNALAKRLIAEKLVAMLSPRATLFMDTGSTTLICAEALAKVKNLTVITNSTRIAAAFGTGRGGAEVYVLGGAYRADNAQTVGAATLADIAHYHADIALLTIGGLDQSGAMDFSHAEAMVARAMAAASTQVVVLADHSKFGRRAAFGVCGLADISTLVSDTPPDESLRAALGAAGVTVL